MSFGVFFLYFLGAIVVLMVGYVVLAVLIRLAAGVTIGATDSIKESQGRRATRKWEAAVEAIEDEEEGDS